MLQMARKPFMSGTMRQRAASRQGPKYCIGAARANRVMVNHY
jgi:hypothetical protein